MQGIGFLTNTVEFWEGLYNRYLALPKGIPTPTEKKEFMRVKEYIYYQIRYGIYDDANTHKFKKMLKRLQEIDLSSVTEVRKARNNNGQRKPENLSPLRRSESARKTQRGAE